MKLKTILRLNALSCLSFGILFVILPGAVAQFLSTSPAPSWLISIIGFALIINGLHLIWVSIKTSTSKYAILQFSLGDFLWVIGTLALILANRWITTSEGILVSLIIALVVGIFGWYQWVQFRQLQSIK